MTILLISLAIIAILYLLAFALLFFIAWAIEKTQPTEEDFNNLNARYNAEQEK